MLNEQYILSLIRPRLNSNRELSEIEFLEFFSELARREQYEVINIMIKHEIELVDEKEEETKELDNASILHMDGTGKDYRRMMQLTNEQLCVMYQQGDTAALTALVEKNKLFVYQIAMKIEKQYRQQSLTVEDLYIEGNLGLIEAAKKYDVKMDYKFTTYSWYWIRQKIIRSAMDTGYMIRIPVHLFEKLIKINNCRRRHVDCSFSELLQYLNNEEEMNLTSDGLEKLIVYSDLYMNTVSLNDIVGEEDDTERIEFIPDENINTEDMVIGEFLKNDLSAALNTLTERERTILDLRFGLSSGNEMTLEQVGEIYNLTRERIRQIEENALKKLRHPSRLKKLRDYL